MSGSSLSKQSLWSGYLLTMLSKTIHQNQLPSFYYLVHHNQMEMLNAKLYPCKRAMETSALLSKYCTQPNVVSVMFCTIMFCHMFLLFFFSRRGVFNTYTITGVVASLINSSVKSVMDKFSAPTPSKVTISLIFLIL